MHPKPIPLIMTPDGRAGAELSRRIGMAKADFKSLCRVWRHSALIKRRKLHIFAALVESKLSYGLAAAVFTEAQQRNLDGFQSRCLRSILRIPAAYYSRISNDEVLRRASAEKSSGRLSQRQIRLLGRASRAPTTNPLRSSSFVGSTV